jgi:hypothetical protein
MDEDREREPLERRSFLRRSAEVAAASLFGLGALDPLIDRVLARMGEMEGANQLAAGIARHLADSGVLTPRAHAARSTPDCPSDYGPAVGGGAESPFQKPGGPPLFVCAPVPGFTCPAAQSFTCHAGTNPRFMGCHYTTPGFQCEWGEDFYCQVDDSHFDCDQVEGQNVGFSCPPWAGDPLTAWFDCIAQGEGTPVTFDCSYPTSFDCGGLGGVGYLCAGTAEAGFEPACVAPWNCANTPTKYHEDCIASTVACPPPEAGFACSAPVEYNCGGKERQDGHFACDLFTCTPGGTPTQWDFNCENLSFRCGSGAGEQTFECRGGHVFDCTDFGHVQNRGFSCGQEGQGDSFSCAAGGVRCGVGATGSYGTDGYVGRTPGDFYCDGHNTQEASFDCQGSFECIDVADDFVCMDTGDVTSFLCTNAFSGCAPPRPEGVFQCDNAAHDFVCQGGFVCPGGEFAL